MGSPRANAGGLEAETIVMETIPGHSKVDNGKLSGFRLG